MHRLLVMVVMVVAVASLAMASEQVNYERTLEERLAEGPQVVVFMQQRDMPRAQALADRIVRQQPENADAYLLRGRLAMFTANMTQARMDFNKARELAPQDPLPLVQLAELEARTGNMAAGRRLMDEVAERFPDSPTVLIAQADMIAHGGDRAAAMVKLIEAVDRIESSPAMMDRVGALLAPYYLQEEAWQPLKDLTDRGMALSPNLLWQLYRAFAANQLGDKALALADASAVVDALDNGSLQLPQAAALQIRTLHRDLDRQAAEERTRLAREAQEAEQRRVRAEADTAARQVFLDRYAMIEKPLADFRVDALNAGKRQALVNAVQAMLATTGPEDEFYVNWQGEPGLSDRERRDLGNVDRRSEAVRAAETAANDFARAQWHYRHYARGENHAYLAMLPQVMAIAPRDSDMRNAMELMLAERKYDEAFMYANLALALAMAHTYEQPWYTFRNHDFLRDLPRSVRTIDRLRSGQADALEEKFDRYLQLLAQQQWLAAFAVEDELMGEETNVSKLPYPLNQGIYRARALHGDAMERVLASRLRALDAAGQREAADRLARILISYRPAAQQTLEAQDAVLNHYLTTGNTALWERTCNQLLADDWQSAPAHISRARVALAAEDLPMAFANYQAVSRAYNNPRLRQSTLAQHYRTEADEWRVAYETQLGRSDLFRVNNQLLNTIRQEARQKQWPADRYYLMLDGVYSYMIPHAADPFTLINARASVNREMKNFAAAIDDYKWALAGHAEDQADGKPGALPETLRSTWVGIGDTHNQWWQHLRNTETVDQQTLITRHMRPAAEAFEKALTLGDAQQAAIQAHLSRLYREMGDDNKALAAANIAVAQADANSQAMLRALEEQAQSLYAVGITDQRAFEQLLSRIDNLHILLADPSDIFHRGNAVTYRLRQQLAEDAGE